MDRTVIVLVTHRGLCDETAEAVAALQCPSIIKVKGLANLAKARSLAFEKAFQATEGTPVDTVLSIDDDMVFGAKDVNDLVGHSRVTAECCAGVALNHEGKLTARPLTPLVVVPGSPVRWLTGLACMAIPRQRMKRIRPKLREVGGIPEWCQTGAHPDYPGEWLPEDFWFCHHFGGVVLLPVAIGHIKPMPLWPDDRMLREIVQYRGPS
jgi:hypothetical protein